MAELKMNNHDTGTLLVTPVPSNTPSRPDPLPADQASAGATNGPGSSKQPKPPRKKLTFSHEERVPTRIKELLEEDRSYSAATSFETYELGKTKWEHKTVNNLKEEVESWPKDQHLTKLLIVKGHDQRESPTKGAEAQPTSCYPLTIPKDYFKALLDRTGIPLIYAAILFQHNARYFTFRNGKRAGFILHMRNPGFSLAVSYPGELAEGIKTDAICAKPAKVHVYPENTINESPVAMDPEEEIAFEKEKAAEEALEVQAVQGLESVQNDTTTYIIVQGLRERDIKALNQEIMDCCPAIWAPAMVATCLMEMMGVWTNKDSSKIYDNIRSTESELETKATSLLKRPDRPKRWFMAKDLDPISRDLTIIATSLSRIDHQCHYADFMLDIIIKTNKDKHLCFLGDALETRIDDLKCWFGVLRSEATFYLTRTEANRATCFSLIQQQDNYTNMSMARTNLRESIAMKEIAKATAHDSSRMLYFSIITFILLPATFTGTFFSSTFFSFQDDGWKSSQDLWIYFAVTIPLMIVVSGGYILWKKAFPDKTQEKWEQIEQAWQSDNPTSWEEKI